MVKDDETMQKCLTVLAKARIGALICLGRCYLLIGQNSLIDSKSLLTPSLKARRNFEEIAMSGLGCSEPLKSGFQIQCNAMSDGVLSR